MKGSFLEISLGVILLFLVVLYYYQSKINKNNKVSKEQNNSVATINNTFTNSSQNGNDKSGNEGSVKVVRHLGPSIDFHKKFVNQDKSTGWRNWWLKNKSNYQVDEDSNFHGTSVRNYLNHMDSTNNIYLN